MFLYVADEKVFAERRRNRCTSAPQSFSNNRYTKARYLLHVRLGIIRKSKKSFKKRVSLNPGLRAHAQGFTRL